MRTSSAAAGGSRRWIAVALLVGAAGLALGAIIDMTKRDFRLPGTQIGEVHPYTIHPTSECRVCHGDFDDFNDPYTTWSGSLMGQAGRDPLFFAQMTNANQDVGNVGNYCLRCHVPMSYVTTHANDPSGATLDARDREGVSCHLCHAMVDPRYVEGVSPPEDAAILAGLAEGPPQFYANAMFVLDPSGARRGPREDAQPMHELIHSPFHTTGNFCGTCHEVGNVAVTRQANGTYRYNAIDAPTPSTDPAMQFPLERTFSEWRHSAFANGGVDMGGRFGGEGASVISTCQDCHMPRYTGMACAFGPERPDARRHEFAGAAAQVLDLIAAYTEQDPAVDQAALAQGRARAVSMLERAAKIEVSQEGGTARVRVINYSGHKLPTGHIEGRRVWVNVRFLDAQGGLVAEHGGYNPETAELDEHSTTVYEMVVGLSDYAASVTGLPAGPTGRMSLADTIVKDNRIPPMGFTNAAYEDSGCPSVGETFADGQHWHDTFFAIPAGAARVQARLYYQNTPRHYIESLRDNNHTDQWGQVLHDLWERTGKGAPILMARFDADLGPLCDPDLTLDGNADQDDVAYLVNVIAGAPNPAGTDPDFNRDGNADQDDVMALVNVIAGGACP